MFILSNIFIIDTYKYFEVVTYSTDNFGYVGSILVSDPEYIVINLGTVNSYFPSIVTALKTPTPYSDFVSLKSTNYILLILLYFYMTILEL